MKRGHGVALRSCSGVETLPASLGVTTIKDFP